ncbi:MAG: hypothetical protein TIS_00827 [Tissierella sp.]|jgi:hypothetical protein
MSQWGYFAIFLAIAIITKGYGYYNKKKGKKRIDE